ncbi:MAG TPA: hypothetical protein VI299_16685 [Polyangiales bacterium]
MLQVIDPLHGGRVQRIEVPARVAVRDDVAKPDRTLESSRQVMGNDAVASDTLEPFRDGARWREPFVGDDVRGEISSALHRQHQVEGDQVTRFR